MKGSTMIVLFVLLLAVGVLVFVLTGQKNVPLDAPVKVAGEEAENQNSQGNCITVPSSVRRGFDIESTQWTSYKKELRKQLNIEHPSNEASKVMGFFKAIDVIPNGANIKRWKTDIKAWIEGNGEVHWDVMETGYLAC